MCEHYDSYFPELAKNRPMSPLGHRDANRMLKISPIDPRKAMEEPKWKIKDRGLVFELDDINYEDNTLFMENDRMALYGWVSTFNPYTQMYKMTNREHYFELFDNESSEYVFKSPSLDDIELLVVRADGDIEKVKELVNNI
jgi:hypothetical protein